MKSYIVIGLGRFGTEVARQLYAHGCEVLAVDSNEELVNQVSSDVTHAVVADARDKGVLRALGAAEFECAVVAIGGSLGNSVLATMNMKELGMPCIVCKAHDEVHSRVLKKLGADKGSLVFFLKPPMATLVAWVLLGEMFNNRIRTTALGLAAAAQWLANFAVSTAFPPMAEFNLVFTYGFYAVSALLSLLFVARFIPETTGRALEDME